MLNEIFVNIPVENLDKSNSFFTALGFKINEKFSGPNNTCLVLTPTISVMLTQQDNFTKMINKPIFTKGTNEAVISLGCDSTEIVKQLTTKAVELGAKALPGPEDQGFMFSWGFEDLDGHLWDLFWMERK